MIGYSEILFGQNLEALVAEESCLAYRDSGSRT